MGLKRIVIIYEKDKFTKQMILDDLESEEFRHFFKFLDDIHDYNVAMLYLNECDEVWIFGDVDNELDYHMAKDLGKEVWRMG